MTHKYASFAVTVLAVGLMTTTAMAGRGWGKGDGNERAPFGGRMYAALDLTAEQQAKIDAIHDKAAKESDALRAKLDGLRDKMHAEWLTSKPNKATLMKINREMHDVKRTLGEKRIETRLAVRAVLTPAQQEKMKTFMKERPRDGRGPGFNGRGFGKHRMGNGNGPRGQGGPSANPD